MNDLLGSYEFSNEVVSDFVGGGEHYLVYEWFVDPMDRLIRF